MQNIGVAVYLLFVNNREIREQFRFVNLSLVMLGYGTYHSLNKSKGKLLFVTILIYLSVNLSTF